MDKINFMLIMHFSVYATLEVIIIGTVNHATWQHKPHSLRITSTIILFLTAMQTYNLLHYIVEAHCYVLNQVELLSLA